MTDRSANPNESFMTFLAAHRPAPTPDERAAARRTLRTWMPLLLVLMILTTDTTPAGIASRVIVIAAVVAEWARLARPVAWLDARWVQGLWLVLLGFSIGHGLWRIHPAATGGVALYAIIVLTGALRSWRRTVEAS